MSTDVLRRNHVEIRGAGPTMVFAHGFGCDQRMWRFVQPAFEADYRCVLFDHTGCGRSDLLAYERQRYAKLDGYAEDLLEVLASTAAGEKVTFVGHSAGASMGLLASIRAPERFERLVLVAPSPRFLDDPPHYRGGYSLPDIEQMLDFMEKNLVNWAHYLAPMAFQCPERVDLTEELIASFCAGDPAIGRRFAETVFLADLRPLLPQVSVPTLILQCQNDAFTPVEVGEYMHRQIPNSTLRILEASGHLPHMSHPDVTRDAIRDYLPKR